MTIALIAHDKKKDEIIQLAIKYKDILSSHDLYATGTTGTLIMGETALSIHRMKSGPLGGDQQILPLVAVVLVQAEGAHPVPIALEGEFVVVDADGVHVLGLFMTHGDEEDLDAFQFIGGHASMDAVLVAVAGGEEGGSQQDCQEKASFHSYLTLACTRSSENTASYTPRVSKCTFSRVKSGTLKE